MITKLEVGNNLLKKQLSYFDSLLVNKNRFGFNFGKYNKFVVK